MAGSDFIVGYLFGRHGGFARWRGRERTRPKMPSGPWRLAAVLCIAAGTVVAWLIAGLGWRLLGGAAIGFVVGMYIVETVWEHQERAHTEVSDGPIGPRS